MDLISIIIPTFNRASRAHRVISSYFSTMELIASNFKSSLEWIIVDDCSTDINFEYLKKKFEKKSNVKILKNEKNSGPGISRNLGLMAARGKWIWFLDDDDQIDIESIAKLFTQLITQDEKIDLVAHSLKKQYINSSQKNSKNILQNILAFHEYQEVFRFLIKRELLKLNFVNFSDGYHEDIEFLVKVLTFSKEVCILDSKLIIKKKNRNSITAKMNYLRIEGYINSFNRTCDFLSNNKINNQVLFQKFFQQTLGVILYLITKETNDAFIIKLLDYLNQLSCKDDKWSSFIRIPFDHSLLDTNFKIAGSIWTNKNNNNSQDTFKELRKIFHSRLTCKDLDSSLFLGPDEIRACCKRFFVNGIKKGDVVLLKAKESISYNDIQNAKNELITRINSGEASECSGCPYIERKEIENNKINYVSFENFSYCNMRCNYCSPKYYGGSEAKYNAITIINDIIDKDLFDINCHIVWGGGEPTLSPRFESINNKFANNPKINKIRILTNSLSYSKSLEKNLDDPRFHIVTSIDAGTEFTFNKIRGRSGIEKVLTNLVKYKSFISDPRRLTLKYIISEENCHSEELMAFVELIKNYNFQDSLFQISINFNFDKPIDKFVYSLYELSTRLKIADFKYIFFDDLVRDRVVIEEKIANGVLSHLLKNNLNHSALLTPKSDKKIVLWGDGKQANWLKASTLTGQSGQIIATVKNITEWNAIVKEKNLYIYPAGVQSMYEILKNIDQSRLSDLLHSGVIL